ncbi:hypothetical protein LCGC14_1210740 [marine sediment metagenome]|uniref:Uncharacterized protein n=2 Tax=root TaxID=1 RepID=A0A831QN04_9FLAO|nr:hypothetical protein [Pricia sp.]HEA19627.1 hypothetical protein [Pricia antarctica]
MDLKDYIKETIISISGAIEESQSELGEKGVLINPDRVRAINDGYRVLGGDANGATHLTDLEFDVLIAVNEGTMGGGGAKLQVAHFINVGAKVEGTESTNQTNRLKFSIPIAFTTSKVDSKSKQYAVR